MTDSGAAAMEATIGRWLSDLEQRDDLSGDEVAELEGRLRRDLAELTVAGLGDDEALLVALARAGRAEIRSREFTRAHLDRMWQSSTETSADPERSGGRRDSALAVMLTLAICAAITVKAGLLLLPELTFVLVMSVLVAPFLAGYLAWTRRAGARPYMFLTAILVLIAVTVGLYPHGDTSDTAVLIAIHLPIVAWFLVGVAHAGGQWRSDGRRREFLRFTGEFIVYYVLLALGGGALIGVTAGSFAAVGLDISGFIVDWVLPAAIPGAVLVAAHLVETKHAVVGTIATVLSRVFTPLTIVMLTALIGAFIAALDTGDADRTLLIMMDLVLVLVLGLVLYSSSAGPRGTRREISGWLLLIMLLAALLVDLLMLVVMVSRVAEFGWTANRITALGINLIILVNLARSASLMAHEDSAPHALERWQMRYLPIFCGWALLVVVAVPPIFAFA